ncbi:MAG: DUF3261 domain-containing protein [Gammaproteobacteria bacterium]
MRKSAALFATAATALALAGCASDPAPVARLGLRLAPAALGESIALQQHLTVERKGRIDELDAAVEADANAVQVVGLALGQRVLSVKYDGKELSAWRHVMLPRQVRAEDVLEDLQLTLWPVEAIAQALPAGWRIEEQGLSRTLYLDDAQVARITYSGAPRWSGTVVLDNQRYGYRLSIESASVQ